MKIRINGYINGLDTIKIPEAFADNGNVLFHTVLGVIDSVKEEAYDDSHDWAVCVTKYDGKGSPCDAIVFYGSDPWDVFTVIHGETMLGRHDEYLSFWL